VVRTVDFETGLLHEQFSIRSAGNDGLHAAAGDTLAIGDWQSGTVDCYSFEKRRQTRSIQPAGLPAYGMSLSSDGKTLVLPDQKGLIHVYDVTTGRVLQSQSATGVTSAVLSPDGRWLAHVGWPPTNSGLFVCVADLQSPRTPAILDTTLDDPAWVGFTAASTQIAVAGYQAAELYDLGTRKRLGRVVLDEQPVLAWNQFGAGWRSGGLFSHFALSPDGRTLASFNGEEVLLWDMHSGQLRHRIASRSRTLQILIFALGFCAWAIGWGTVARRQRPTAIPYQPPIELRLIWGLMFIGGFVATTVPAALLVVSGPLVWPGMYYALGVGLVLIAGAECVALLDVARFEPLHEPAHALLGSAVRK
jgi:WD40 repeat protein